MKALISSGTTPDALKSVITRLYEEYGIEEFLVIGTGKSIYNYEDIKKFGDFKVEVNVGLSESDFNRNIESLKSLLKDIDVVDLTGGTKAMAGSIGIASILLNKPVSYLEGPTEYFKSYYPFTPRTLQRFSIYGKISGNKKKLKFEENFPNETNYLDFPKIFSYIFNYLTVNGDYTLKIDFKGNRDASKLYDLSTDEMAWKSLEKALQSLGTVIMGNGYYANLSKGLNCNYGYENRNDLTLDFLTNVGYCTLTGEGLDQLRDKLVIVDTNVLFTYDFVKINPRHYITIDCVKEEISHKSSDEKNPFARLAIYKLDSLGFYVEDYKNCIEEGSKNVKNKCDACLITYVERLPNYLSDDVVFLTRDKNLYGSFSQKTKIKRILLKEKKADYERGRGYYSFFKLLYLYVILTGESVKMENVMIEPGNRDKVNIKLT
ncbi:hypothetical protein V6M85_03205 [Sulfolobus tengchongensis]|uniref:CRISPR-associated protein n=1 Tax=Sulfolobus tengchongensis TaxID=207809 RepID=A0AAX4L1K4_9CREN